jgi:hypothetical protein
VHPNSHLSRSDVRPQKDSSRTKTEHLPKICFAAVAAVLRQTIAA